MDRNVPDAWTVFALQRPSAAAANRPPRPPANAHYNWSSKNRDQLLQWCDRSSVSERPRTYDKFYQKTPGNFHQDPEKKSSGSPVQTDSAISVCSSEDDAAKKREGKRVRRRSKGKRGELNYSRTVTERDVRHLERHLSMKKTIRKKIMRDLQQAFVDDPAKVGRDGVVAGGLGALNFDPASSRADADAASGPAEDHKLFLLDMLRDGGSDDSGIGGGGSAGRSRKFHSVRERSKSCQRRFNCEGDLDRAAEKDSPDAADAAGSEDVIVVLEGMRVEEGEEGGSKAKKTSFWKFFKGKKK